MARYFSFVLVLLVLCNYCSADDGSEIHVHSQLIEKQIDFAPIINRTNNSSWIGVTTGFEYFLNISAGLLLNGEDDIEVSNQRRAKKCSDNLELCMENDRDYEQSMRQLMKFMKSSVPPFDLSKTEGVTEECRQASAQYVEDLEEYKYWALKMYDSTGKLPTGLLNGNIQQLGDYNLCMAANREPDIYGKYCLAAMQFETPHVPYLAFLHDRLHSHYLFKSKLGDPDHRTPRFSAINWAICVPHQCTGKDVEIGLRNALGKVMASTDLEYQIEVNPKMCSTSLPRTTWNYELIFGASFFILVILFQVFAAVYDMFYETEHKKEWILSFSMIRNIKSLISIEPVPNDIEAVHSIRFLNAFMLIMAHKSMALMFLPYTNRTEMAEWASQWWSVLVRAASLYTDPFLMMSGLITAYSLYGRLQRTGKINIAEEYLSRLFRIVPSFAALILFCTFVFPHISSGPMWNQVVTEHSTLCKQYWWRNLLFIHNYFGFKNMCLTHTHHVGIDTQLFFVSPFFILLLWKWPRRGSFALTAVAIISTCLRYYTTYSHNLNYYVNFGASTEQMFNTADYTYIIPPHRVTVYIMGIFLGFLLRSCRNVILTPVQMHIGSFLAVTSLLVSFFSPAIMGTSSYVYNPTHAAWYAAFSPILWCFGFAWFIFCINVGFKAPIYNTLRAVATFPYFKIWTRISYAVYLTQFPVFFYNVGTTKHSEYYSTLPKNLNILELGCIIGLSTALTVLFEMPFQNLKKVIFNKKPKAMNNIDPIKKTS